VRSFQSLLRDRATCTLNKMTITLNDASASPGSHSRPIQAQACASLAIDPTRLCSQQQTSP
jgi:hypothetical protein